MSSQLQSRLPRILLPGLLGVVIGAAALATPAPPAGLVARTGDQSIILHWDPGDSTNLTGWHVYRRTEPNAPFTRITAEPTAICGYADVTIQNGTRYHYRVRSVDPAGQESPDSEVIAATPVPFRNEDAFLDLLQQTAFDFFWYEANPANGLVRDRSRPSSYCSIAAVGFGLTAIPLAIEHGWITRPQGSERTLRILRTFRNGRQGPEREGTIGHRGWFYHFIDMTTAERRWRCELSSIDTVLFLAGALYAREYFDGPDAIEQEIRRLATELYDRIDWEWMTNGEASLSMGWHPESGFIKSRWIGYNEAMILYILALGANRDPLPPAAWTAWTAGYDWKTSHGQSFVHFPPLFGHQYSHCWIDFRGIADGYLRARGIDYFENSRRATLAQQAYSIANPGGFRGYSERVWGLTACDGPGFGNFKAYSARGAPPPENDDGTIAPTAAGGSIPFAPEICLPTLRHFYDSFRTNIWRPYGFCDAFNLQAGWWDPEVIGIDQGPICLMIENHRTGRVWRTFMKIPEVRRGLERAGFQPTTGR